MATHIRLKLKTPYTYGSRNQNSNDTGHIQTNLVLIPGAIVRFELFNAKNDAAGSLATDHFKHFQNRKFRIVKLVNPIEWLAEEI